MEKLLKYAYIYLLSGNVSFFPKQKSDVPIKIVAVKVRCIHSKEWSSVIF